MLAQREAELIRDIQDQPGDSAELGPTARFIAGGVLQGKAVKGQDIRITTMITGGTSAEEEMGYADRTNLYSFDISIQTKSRIRFLEATQIIIDRLTRQNYSWALNEEEYSDSIGYSISISV